MANVCVNTIYFCAENRELLLELFNKIRSCYDSMPAKNIYDLFRMHGYKDSEIDHIVDKRDDITACDGILTRVDGYYYFEAETCTAWIPHMDVFYKLIEEKYGNRIRIFYCSEENGCEIYTTNDIDGIFFDAKFRLDFGSDDDSDVVYFDNFKKLVQYTKDRFSQDISEIDDLRTMEEKILRNLGDYNKEYYCEINRFNYDYERSAA